MFLSDTLCPTVICVNAQVAALAAAETARREHERAQIAKDAIDAAIALRDRSALADAVAIASGIPVAASDELQTSLAVGTRMLAYLQLCALKPKHAAWSCAEVRAVFETLSLVHELAADSTAAVVKYLADERANGSLLSVLASSSRTLERLVPDDLRRHRLVAILTEMCADPAAGGPAAAGVSVAAEIKLDAVHVGDAHTGAVAGAAASLSPAAAVACADSSTAIARLKDVPLSGLRCVH
jgi:hypothetical protein